MSLFHSLKRLRGSCWLACAQLVSIYSLLWVGRLLVASLIPSPSFLLASAYASRPWSPRPWSPRSRACRSRCAALDARSLVRR
ncbi:hypothetical protein XA68_10190 [Ophiocordyceps unilateralis]|uniref:Uncharacterized protein n=1 Tax=Ophiocordyceps unilateralis TaxID=268505 RepID=A0A2A9PJ10_OPHUN|nr:hypothetical protein XA68_10190 [Ophiocordyceps unilateralis]